MILSPLMIYLASFHGFVSFLTYNFILTTGFHWKRWCNGTERPTWATGKSRVGHTALTLVQFPFPFLPCWVSPSVLWEMSMSCLLLFYKSECAREDRCIKIQTLYHVLSQRNLRLTWPLFGWSLDFPLQWDVRFSSSVVTAWIWALWHLDVKDSTGDHGRPVIGFACLPTSILLWMWVNESSKAWACLRATTRHSEEVGFIDILNKGSS